MKTRLEFPDDIRPDFMGFTPSAFKFLAELRNSNERTWFKTQKMIYDLDVKFTMECLLAEFSDARRPTGFPVQGDPKRGAFRIYRDVRFSKNKNPYKTHAGAVMTRSGSKGDPGLIYVHIEPGQCFLSAGFYSPTREFLAAWRTRIATKPDHFLEMIEEFVKPRSKYYLRRRAALKTMPRGFQQYAESPVADYLKFKNFLVGRKITDKQAQSRKLLDLIADFGKTTHQILALVWEVHETAYEDDPRKHMRSKV